MWRLALASSLVLASVAVAASDIARDRQRELVRLVRHDCGACHGLTLQGGLGPALTPAALAGKPAQWLQAVILEGRPGTPMPPWRPFITETEARWLVDALQTGKLDER